MRGLDVPGLTRFSLEQITGGSDFWQWKPNGSNGCVTLGLSCVGVSEAFNANDSAQTTGVPVSSSDHSYLGGSATGAFSAGTGNTLSTGTWTLTLFNKVSTVVSRTVPEPSTVLLLGAGLAGLGFGRRYRSKKS